MEEMSYDEFIKTVKENPDGFLFKIICKKCSSDKVVCSIDGDIYGGGEGCDTCGYGSESDVDISVIFKCNSCGNAFHIKKKIEGD